MYVSLLGWPSDFAASPVGQLSSGFVAPGHAVVRLNTVVKIFCLLSCVAALAIFAPAPSNAQQNHVGVTTSHGDPAQVVRKALLPLFQHKKGADRAETSFFSAELRKLADDYFSAGNNAGDFDADWLLGMQDWGGMTPSFSTFVLDDQHAKIKVSFALDQKYVSEGGQTPSPNIYTAVFDDPRGWTIDDVVYSDGLTLRDIISHNTWCRRAFHDEANVSACKIDMWK